MVLSADGIAVTPNLVGAKDILALAIVIAIAMWAAVAVYRSIQRPRLVLAEVAPRQWRARRRDVALYAVSIPFLLIAWNGFLMIILLVGVNSLDAERIVVVAGAVVVASRALAHLSTHHAHELAKTIPLTLVALVLINGDVRGWESVAKILQDFANTSETWPATFLLLMCEVAFTAAWYWIGVRWWYLRGHDVAGLPSHASADQHLAALPAERMTASRNSFG